MLQQQFAFAARPRVPVRTALAPRAAGLASSDRSLHRSSCTGHPRVRQHDSLSLVERLLAGAWQTGISFLTALMLICEPAQAAETLQGLARTVDGDTLEVAGTRIRLWGVDAPEKAQSCKKGGKDYACGQDAKDALAAKIGQAPVLCEVKKDKDLYGRTIAACSAGGGRGGDLGAFMVENGYAVAYRQYSKEYIPLEEKAQAGKLGIWSGDFQEPSQWRKDHPRGAGAGADASATKLLPAPPTAIAALPAPSAESVKRLPPNPACAIKGNINAKGEKIYHIPGGRSYNSTEIVVEEGERWFCSEQEATSAGWRAAKN